MRSSLSLIACLVLGLGLGGIAGNVAAMHCMHYGDGIAGNVGACHIVVSGERFGNASAIMHSSDCGSAYTDISANLPAGLVYKDCIIDMCNAAHPISIFMSTSAGYYTFDRTRWAPYEATIVMQTFEATKAQHPAFAEQSSEAADPDH